jgi:hypothetical protein
MKLKKKSAKVNVRALERVRRFLKARTQSEAIAKAIELVDERRLFHEFVEKHGGTLRPEDFEDYPPR